MSVRVMQLYVPFPRIHPPPRPPRRQPKTTGTPHRIISIMTRQRSIPFGPSHPQNSHSPQLTRSRSQNSYHRPRSWHSTIRPKSGGTKTHHQTTYLQSWDTSHHSYSWPSMKELQFAAVGAARICDSTKQRRVVSHDNLSRAAAWSVRAGFLYMRLQAGVDTAWEVGMNGDNDFVHESGKRRIFLLQNVSSEVRSEVIADLNQVTGCCNVVLTHSWGTGGLGRTVTKSLFFASI